MEEPESWETLRNDLDGLFPEDADLDCNDTREAVLSLVRAAHLAGQRAMREAAAAAVRAEENRQTERPIWDPVSLPAMILDLSLLDPDQEGEDPGHGPDNCKGRIVPWIAEDGSCVLGERCADCRCTWMNTVPTPIGCTEYVPDSYDGPGTCGRCGETHPTDEAGNVLDRTWCPERGEE